MKKGFTLLELIVVIIILGILASLGFIQYLKMIERSRVTEAKAILGQIRHAQEAYKLENGIYSADLSNLTIVLPSSDCTQQSTHYFSYTADATKATATRCTSGGKNPPGPTSGYYITLDYTTAQFGGTPGYY